MLLTLFAAKRHVTRIKKSPRQHEAMPIEAAHAQPSEHRAPYIAVDNVRIDDELRRDLVDDALGSHGYALVPALRIPRDRT